MREFVCNFAIIRFLPYRERGEFVNVGVVLSAPQTGFFDFLLETRQHKRVTNFFPELNEDFLTTGLKALETELRRFRTPSVSCATAPSPAQEAVSNEQHRFRELVRPRESLFSFSEIATAVATDPKQKLCELFEYYVERLVTHDERYQEIGV